MALPLYMRRGLQWYRKVPGSAARPQDECLAGAERLGHTVHIKWGQYLFSHIQSYSDLRYLISHNGTLAPAGERVITPPMYLLFVLETAPCQFMLDIEWYMDGAQLSASDAKQRVRDIVALIHQFNEQYHDHHCRLRAYVSSCSRDTHKPYNAAAGSGGYKYSYHVLVRCSERCYFHSYDHWKQYASQFLGYLRRVVHPTGRYPWLFYGAGDAKCAVDDGVYTRKRAMRMIDCAKDPGGQPLRRDAFDDTDEYAASRDTHDDIMYHVHGYIEPGGSPFILCDNPHLCAQPQHARAQRPAVNTGPRAMPLPEPTTDELHDYVLHVLQALGRHDIRYEPHDMILIGTEHQTNTISRLLGAVLSPAARMSLRPYKTWFRLCCMCVRYVHDRDAARTLWLRLATEINKPDEDPVYQFDRACLWVDRGRLNDTIVSRFEDDMTHLARHLGIDNWQRIDDDEGGGGGGGDERERYMCLASDDVQHEYVHARIDRLAYQRQGAIVFACRCGRDRFVGYIPEHGSIISNERYIGQSEDLVRAFDRAVASAHNPYAAKIDFIVIGQMGTGKTELLMRMGRNTEASVLGIVMRQALGHDLRARLKQPGGLPDIGHYVIDKRNLTSLRQLLIQLESIWRLTRDGRVITYDIVFVDELESLLLHFSSETLDSNRQQIFDTFMYIVTNARVFISCDADTGPATLEFLATARNGRRMIYRNLSTPLQRAHTVYGNTVDWYNQLARYLDDGLNIVIVCNSKRRLDGIHKMVADQGITCKFYTSRTPQIEKQGVAECTTEWTRYRVVGYTGVISAGVNCMARHFDACFVLAQSGSSVPQQIHQMIGRVRLLRLNEVHTLICSSVVPSNIETLTTFDGCVEHLIRRDEVVVNKARALAARCQLDFDDGSVRLDITDPLNRVLTRNLTTQMQAMHNYLYWYRFYAKLHGDSCVYVSKEDSGVDRSLIKHNEILEDVHSASLSDSQQLSEAERPLVDINDLNDARPDVSPEQLVKERWCTFLTVPNITHTAIWDILKSSSSALPGIVTLVLALYPDRQLATEVVMSSVVTDRRPPMYNDPQLSELLSFVARLKQFSATRLCYRDYVERGAILGEMLQLMGGIHVAHLPMAYVTLDTWLASLPYRDRLPQLCPSRIFWGGRISDPKKALAACDAILRLGNLKAESMGGGSITISDVHLHPMLNLVALCCPLSYAALVQRPSPYFPDVFE